MRWDAENQEQMAWVIDARHKHWKGKKTVFLQPYDLVIIPTDLISDIALWVQKYIVNLIPFPRFVIPV